MVEVNDFDSLDALSAYLRDVRIKAAGAETRGFQELIDPGDHYAVWSDAGIMIFGEVLEPDPAGALVLRDAPWRRLVRAYSVACPGGEFGCEHVGNMIPISPELFALARQRGWHQDTWGAVAVRLSVLLREAREAEAGN